MEKILFCRIGWMRKYQGMDNDSIIGGGSYVKEKGFGHEMYNFTNFNGYCYGNVQPSGGKTHYNDRAIHIERLGAGKHEDRIKGVLVIWTAKSPNVGKSVIIGWYKEAVVFRYWQEPSADSGRFYQGVPLGYYIRAAVENAHLLKTDERVFLVPQKGKGSFGRTNIWYADKKEAYSLRRELLSFIKRRRLPPSVVNRLKEIGAPRQPDIEKRKEIEESAIREVIDHYHNKLQFEVERVDSLNFGWDLRAYLGNHVLLIEVKGLSGKRISVALTPNEYASMHKYRNKYRVAVVTSATSSHPHLTIFSFNPKSEYWESDDGLRATIEESTQISAVLKA